MKKLTIALVALACLAAVPISAAAASRGGHDNAFAIRNVAFTDPTAACPGGNLTFDLVSLVGVPAGTGSSCIVSAAGCEPFAVGCKQVTQAIFTFNLEDGSVTAPMTLHERFVTDSSVTQRGKGKIASGTGSFAVAHGVIEGGGTIAFTATGLDVQLVYAVHADED
jgi:hypothetical protein